MMMRCQCDNCFECPYEDCISDMEPQKRDRRRETARRNYYANREKRLKYAAEYRRTFRNEINAKNKARYHENMKDPEYAEKMRNRQRQRRMDKNNGEKQPTDQQPSGDSQKKS